MMSTRGYPRTTTGLVFLPGGLAMGATLLLSAVVGIRALVPPDAFTAESLGR